jgi:two-component system, cell cycle sensor histidine kinase and response regulator CckA
MTSSDPTGHSANRAPFRILVVDDNPAIHEDFRKILGPAGGAAGGSAELAALLFDDLSVQEPAETFDIDYAHQGQEALGLVVAAVAAGRPYALAFVDVRMPPGWDGIETIRRLWDADTRLQVVICTAYSDYSWEQIRTGLGRPDNLLVLKKPFDNIEVQQLAHALTRKWELSRQAGTKMEELETMVRSRTLALEQANASLTRSEERFAKAFHTSPVAMAIQSLSDRRFVDANERMAQLTGRSRDELLATDAPQSIWAEPPALDAWIDALQRGEVIRDREAAVLHRSGQTRQAQVSLSLVTLSGEKHLLVVAQDVTERIELERQLHQAQKMETVGQLAAGLAHDFNNILTVVQGHAGIIRSHPGLPGPVTESVDEIKQAIDRATKLIRQLLMFSRKQVMQFGRLDLNACMADSRLMISRLVGELITVEFHPDGRTLPIHADRTMIEQVAMNLVVNARDAMPQGGRFTLSTSRVDLDRGPVPTDPEPRCGSFARLTVRDTGCGMTPEVLKRVFEPFFTTKQAGKGTGLGLSIILGIVRQHQGWIEVDSRPGEGTEFRLYFPALEERHEVVAPIDATGPIPHGHETILFAEDQPALRGMVIRFLTAHGYHVLHASSGHEALEIHRNSSRPIDLLLTDVVMPGGILGSELADRLRAIQPDLKVVFISGYNAGMAGRDVASTGPEHFLAKPFTIGELGHVLRRALDGASGP